MTILQLKNSTLTVSESQNCDSVLLEDWCQGAAANVLVIGNGVDINTIDSLDAVNEIVLEFPNFADGRAYSQARLLRERKGFRGTIRATGDVLCDQIQFMARVGIDAFDIGDRNIENYRQALGVFSVFYQCAADSVEPVWIRRERRAVAA